MLLYPITAAAGTLSVTVPGGVTLPSTNLNGQPQSTSSNIGAVGVGDTTGTGNGYHLSVQGTQMKETGGSGYTLPSGSLTLQQPSSLTEQSQDGVNLVANGGFEAQPTVGTVLSDNFTGPGGWNSTCSGTYGGNGYTTGGGCTLTTDFSDFEPALHTVSAQTTVTVPSSGIPADWNVVDLMFYQNGNNRYIARIDEQSGMFEIAGYVNGGSIGIGSGASFTATAGATYTLTFSLDGSGNMTASIYSGTSATGTPLATTSGSNTSLTGNFSVGISVDSSDVISNVDVNWLQDTQQWSEYNTSGIAGTQDIFDPVGAYAGNGSEMFGAFNLTNASYYQMDKQTLYSITPGKSYTASAYVDVGTVSNAQVFLEIDFYSSTTITGSTYVSGSYSTPLTATTSGWQQIKFTGTVPSSAVVGIIYTKISGSAANGYATAGFDNVSYQENDYTNPQNLSELDSNSGFETNTATANLFNDNFSTGYAWNTTAGSYTFGASGATSATSGYSTLVTKEGGYTPYVGSGGQTLPIKEQMTFTTGSSPSYTIGMGWTTDQNNYNCYEVQWQTDDNFVIYKWINNSSVGIASYGYQVSAMQQNANTTYTMTLSIAPNGTITAALYQGTGTTGTQMTSISATDQTYTQNFYATVYAGTGTNTSVVLNSFLINGPWADGWGFYTQGTALYQAALVNTPVMNGNKAVRLSAYNLTSGSAQFVLEGASVTAGDPYTVSGQVWVPSLNGTFIRLQVDFFNASSQYVGGGEISESATTSGYVPLIFTGTIPATATSIHLSAVINYSSGTDANGTVYVDNLKFFEGTTTPATIESTGSTIVDNGAATTLISAPIDTGMGNYMINFPNNALKLTLNPGTTFADETNYPSGTPYSNTLTFTISSGP